MNNCRGPVKILTALCLCKKSAPLFEKEIFAAEVAASMGEKGKSSLAKIILRRKFFEKSFLVIHYFKYFCIVEPYSPDLRGREGDKGEKNEAMGKKRGETIFRRKLLKKGLPL